METVLTDSPAYQGGETAHVTGSGYSPACDVVVNVLRPDGVVDTATATTDLFGNLSYDYLLPGPPNISGEFTVDVLGSGDAQLASTTFSDAPSGSLLTTPSITPTSATRTFHLMFNSTAGSTSGNNSDNPQCITFSLAGFTGISGLRVGTTEGASWSVSLVGGVIRAVANSSGDQLHKNQALFVQATATAPGAAGNQTWSATAFSAATCTLTNSGAKNSTMVVATTANDNYSATVSPTSAQSGVSRTFTVSLTAAAGNPDRANRAVIAIPTGWTFGSLVSANQSANNTCNGGPGASWIADGTIFDAGQIQLKNSGNSSELCPGATLNVVFTATPSTSGGTFVTSMQNGNSASTVFMQSGSQPTVTIDNTAPTVAAISRADANPTGASSVHWTVTFSEPVTGVDATDFALASSGVAGASITGLSGSGSSYTVIASTGTGNGSLGLNLVDDDSIADGAGNKLGGTGTGNGNFTGEVFTVQKNHAPTATISLSDHSPKTNDTLTATATKADADGDPVTLTYVWKVNGVVKKTTSGSSALTDTFDLSLAGNGNKADTVSVAVTPNDGTVDGSTVSDSATVANTAPTVALSGANSLSVNEGSTQTYSYSISDPDGDTIASVNTSCGAHGTKVPASDSFNSTSGSFQCSFDDGPNSTTVSAQANDGTANGNTSTQSVSILNLAPTATLANNGPIGEGSSATIGFSSQSDASAADTSGGFRYEYRCDGSAFPAPADYSSASTSASTGCSFDDNGSYTVRARIIDKDNGATSYTTTVIVQNVAPTATLSNDGPIDEGSSATISFAGQSDPSSADTSAGFHYAYSCSNGDLSSATYAGSGTNPSTSCSYSNGPSTHIVKARIIDKDGGFSEYTTTVSVNNVAPGMTAAADQSTNEGASHSFDLGSFSDTGADAPWHVSVDWGDGSFATVFDLNSAGTIPAQTHTYADGPNDYTVTVSVNDGSATTSKTFAVHVDNVAPSIAISGNASVNEGAAYSLNLGSVSDPGVDTVSSYVVHWGDGQSDTYSSNGAKSHSYADGPNDYAVTVDLVDEDGTATNAANPLSVHVNNVAPSIAISGNANVNEGSSYSLNLGSVSDPGADTVSSYVVHWGDGSTDTYSTNGAKSHTYADGPSDHAITVDLVDEDGTFLDRADTLSVHVNNVAPSIAISGNANVNEGSPYSLTLGAVTDPGADTVSSYVVHWGDGSTDTYSSNGVKSHTYADGPNDYKVTVDLVDEDGTFNNAANPLSVHVNNVAPIAHVSGPANVDEGTTHTYTFTVSDPGQDTFSVNSGYPDCGTGGSYINGSLSTDASGGSFDCFFPNGPVTTNVKIKVTDSDGASDTDSESVQIVQVANVPPDVTAAANQSSNEGASHSFDLGSFTDPGDDSPWHVSVDWGDGSLATTFDVNSTGTIPAHAHTYADGPNDYTVQVTVNDGDDSTSKSFSVHVNNIPPTVTLSASNDLSVDEGSSHTYSYTISDPGQDSVQSVAVDCGANGNLVPLSESHTNSAGSFGCTFPDGDASSTVSVQATDSDGDSGNTDSQSVTIHNVAPSIAISGNANVNEGSSYSLTLGAVTDPGQDTVSSYVVHWGDGNSDTYSSNGVKSHTYADGPDDHNVTVDLVDEDGTFANAANPLSVHVVNIPPTVALTSAPASANEGQTKTYSYSISDPGQDTVSAVHPNCGANGTLGNASNTDTSGSFDCTFPDGPASSTVSISATDSDGDTGNTDSQPVSVANVAPSIAISGNANVDEGSSYSLTLGAVTDPGNDTVSSYVVYWGDGNSDTYSSNGVKSHTYADGPDDHNVTVDLVDEDGTFTNAANPLSVHVNNVAPVAHLTGPANVDEGTTHTYSFTVTDPGDDTFTVNSGYPDCGTGGSYVANTLSTNAGGGSFDCFFPSGPVTTNVKIKVTDSDGASDTSSESVQVVDVANVPPSVTAPANQSSNEGSSHAFDLGSFTDPGADSPWHVTVDWGDGSFPMTAFDMSSPGTIPAQSHTYADGANDYTVTVTVDDGHDPRSKTFSVHVNDVAPVIAISGNANVDEGSSYSLTLGSVSDPGQDTVSSYIVHWGDGQSDTYSSNGAKSHTYADGPNDYNVTVDLVNEDGTFSNAANPLSVHVNNVAPTIAISGNANVDEGSSYSLTLGAVTDPGNDTVSSYIVHWGDGSSDTYPTNGAKSHTYADGPNDYSITVDLVDEDGTYTNAANRLSVHVDNVAPTAHLTGDATADEGTTHTYTYTVSDPGQDTFSVNSGYPTCGSGGNLVLASVTQTPSGGSFQCFFPNGPVTTSVAIKVTDSDGASTTDSESVQVVDVANVPPTVMAPANQSSNEGENHSFSLGSFSDPGADSPWHVTVAWGDGSPATTFDATSAGSLGSKAHTYADGPNDYTVTVSVNDNTDTRSNTFSVHVNNVAPTLTLSGPQNANEGTAYTYSYTVSDPGSETFSRDAQSCDGGTLSNASFNAATGAGSFDCKWDDGSASKSPSVTVSDGDGGSDSKSVAVTVNNVAPTATFGNNGPVNEGQSFTLSLSSPSDPSSADTSAGFQYAFDCGDGSGYGAFSTTASRNCSTTDSGTRSVKGKIKDKDGGVSEYTAAVPVNNVAPTAAFSNTGPVNEGQNFTLTLSSPSDPSSGDTSAGFQYAFDCGSGSGYGAYGPSNTATCPTNDNGTRSVKGKIKDKDGGVSEYTGSVTVNNVAPVVTVTSPAYGTLYAKNGSSNPTITTTASFTDAGTADTHTCSVAWDDGTTSSGTVTESNGSGTCTASHVYTTAGVYTYHVTVADDDGGSTTADWEVVVYDASAGFITGGGWINVAAGSYTADPTLSGRANFGFNSQYKKGATVPTGETEFNFQVGNFNFHSDVYSWLVVSGYKAQYRGTGSVNGVSGYDFTLTAYDGDVGGGGGVDKFRIRITRTNGGNVIFDNRITNGNLDMDTADPQAIAGGSIVIHKA